MMDFLAHPKGCFRRPPCGEDEPGHLVDPQQLPVCAGHGLRLPGSAAGTEIRTHLAAGRPQCGRVRGQSPGGSCSHRPGHQRRGDGGQGPGTDSQRACPGRGVLLHGGVSLVSAGTATRPGPVCRSQGQPKPQGLQPGGGAGEVGQRGQAHRGQRGQAHPPRSSLQRHLGPTPAA